MLKVAQQKDRVMIDLRAGRPRPSTIAAAGLLLGLLPACFVSAAVAETPEGRHACMSDAFRLCNDTIPDVARTTACLAHNRGSLSPLCRAEMPGGRAISHRGYHRSRSHHRR